MDEACARLIEQVTSVLYQFLARLGEIGERLPSRSRRETPNRCSPALNE
jgi:hypothetical protein